MQSYEHIMATMLKVSKSKKNSKGLSLEANLELIRQYGAYFTYPDCIRGLVGKSLDGKSFRPPSHFTNKARMIYIIGKELKNADRYPLDKLYIPDDLEIKAADGPTDLELVKQYNAEVLKTNEGKAIYEHLKQDCVTDEFFQIELAESYAERPEGCNVDEGEGLVLYGLKTKPGLAKYKTTGTYVSMTEYRRIQGLIQKLTTLELFKRLRITYPGITFRQIQDAASASYEMHYPDALKYAKSNVVPDEEEQNKILHALKTSDYSYYDGLKNELVRVGAFISVRDVNMRVTGLIDKVISVDDKDKKIKDGQESYREDIAS